MPAGHAILGNRRGLRAAAVLAASALAALGTVGAADVGAVGVTGDPVLRPALGAPFSHTLSVSGDPLPTDVAFDPELPAGLAGTITGHTLTIAGTTPGPAGSAPTTVTVSNGLTTASLELDLAVTALPVVAPVAPLTVAVGEPIAPVAVTASGWPPPVVDVQGLPPGLAATPTASGARVEGTPSSTGTWTATATATNDVGSDVATFDVVVGSRPTVTAPAARTVTAGAVLDVPVTTTGSPAPALEAAHLPAGLALVDLGGGAWAVRGTTSRAMLGVHAVVLTARNALGEATAGLTLTVQGAPQIAPLPTIRLTVGAPSDAAWVATGYPTPTLAVASGSLPEGVTAVDDGAGRLALTGSPSAIGTYFVEVRAANSLGTVQRFTQVEVGRAPAFAQGRLEQRLLLDDWTWISLDLPYDSLPTVTVTSGSLPPGMWLSDSYLDGRPTALGHYEATITASNEFGSDTLTLVLDVGQAPDLVADEPWGSVSFVATADSPMTGTLTTVGVPPPSLTVIDPLPPGLTLTQDPLDPYAWHLAGTVSRADRGGYSVRVVLSNGFGPDVTRTIAVRVNAPLRWETPNGRTVVTPRGEPMTPVRLHLTGYPVNVGLNRPSSDGGLNIDVDWSTRDVYVDVIGTPRWDQTYTVCPYVGLEQTNPCLTTHIALRDRPVVHVVTPATAHVGDAVGIPVTVTSTHAVTLAAAGLPEGLSLVPSAPGAWTIAGTAEPAAIGRHTVTLTADNGVTGTATLALELTGPPALDGPVAATLLIGETPTTAVRASGLPTPAMTIVDGTLPEGVTAADDGAGNFRLGGAPTQVGAWTVAVQAENEYGTATTTLALTVEERPAFDDDAASLTVREGQSVSWSPGLVGTPAPTVTVSGVLPAGLELAPDGTLSGTVSTGAADAGSGSYAVTLQATNRHGTAALPVTLTVLSSPSFADGLPAATIAADEAAAVTICTAGWDRPALAATGPLPPGLTLAQVDDTTWTLAGTVVRADRGGYDVPLALTNAFGAPVTGTLHLDVAAAHRWTGPTTVEVETGTPFDALDIELTGYPIDHVSIAGSEVVTIQTLADGPTRAAYQVTTAPEEPGTHPITFTSDTGAEHTVTLVVRDRPVIHAPGTATVVSGSQVSIPVTVTGLPVAGLAADGLPPGLSLTPLEGGGWAITGTPERAFGDHAVTLTADNGLVTTRTITLAVEGQPAITAPPTPAEIPLGAPLDLTWAADGVPTPDVALVDPVPPGLTVHRAAGSLTLTGAFAAPGPRSLTIRATNDHGTTELDWDVLVTQEPAFDDDAASLTVREGQSVSWSPGLVGTPAPTVTVSGVLPAGLELAPDGTLSGTVSTGAADAGSGSYAVTLQATNRHGTAALPVTLTVLSSPSFADGLPAATIAADEAAAVTICTAGWDRPALAATGPLPPGLTLAQVDDTTWTLAGTVVRADRGGYDVPLALTNAFGAPVTGTLHLDVAAAHRWTGPTTVEVETGTPFDALDIELTGYPIDHVSIAGSEVVTIQTLADGPTRAAYQVTTAPEEPGTHPITFTSDTGAEHTVTLVVRDRPVIHAPGTATVVSGSQVSIPVTVTGLPVAGLAADGLPPGLSLTPLEGGGWAITGTPERAFGDHAVTLTADNGLVTTQQLVLTVEGPPTVAPPPATGEVALGDAVQILVEVDGGPVPDVEVVGGPAVGIGVVDWAVPGILRIAGTTTVAGPHQLVIRATNLHGTAEQSWDLVVTQPPRFAAPSSEAVMIEGVAVALPLPLAGYPRPVVTLDGEVPGVTLADLGASGPVLVGTPAEGSAGTYDLVLAARSTIGGVEHLAETTVRVRVDARPRFVAGLDPLGAAVGEPVTRTVTLTAAPEATVLAEGLPEGLGLRRTDVDAWVVEGVPAAGTGGVHVARLVADNGVLEPVAGTLEVTVAEPAQVALAVAPLREGRPASLEVSTAGGWPLPARLGVEGPLPTGLRLVDAGDGTGHLVGTPAAGTAGRWPVTVTADNGSGVTRLALTLTVAAAPPSPPVWREPPDPLPVPVVGDPGDTSSSDDRDDTGDTDDPGDAGGSAIGGSDDPGDAGGSAIGGSEDPGDTGGPTGTDPDGRPGADDPGDAAGAPPEWWLLLLTALGMVLAGVAWWLVGRRRRPAD